MVGMVLSRRRWRRASWSSWEWALGVRKGEGILDRRDSWNAAEKFVNAVLRL
jgi:hypothetical protein